MADVTGIITSEAQRYALAQGATPDEAAAFARVAVAIAFGESSLNPAAKRDTTSGYDPLVASGRAQRELSVGLFQLNFMGGRGNASGLTPQQAMDPTLNTRASMKDLWGAFRDNGGGRAFAADPVTTTARTYQQGQGSVAPNVQTQILPGLQATAGGVAPSASGPAPASSPSAAGGAPVSNPQPPNPGSKVYGDMTGDDIIRTFHGDYEAAQRDYDAARQKYEQAATHINLDDPTSYSQLAPLKALMDSAEQRVNGAQSRYVSALGTLGKGGKDYALGYAQLGETAREHDQANQLGYAQLGETGRGHDINLLSAIYGEGNKRAEIAAGLLEHFDTVNQTAAANALRKGEAGLAAARDVVQAHQFQQAAELAGAQQSLDLMGLVGKQTIWNAQHILPAGTRWQPGMEPGQGSAMGQALGQLGIQYQGMPAGQANLADLDPWQQYGRARASVPQPHDAAWWGIPGIEAAGQAIQNINIPTPQQHGAGDIGLPGQMSDDPRVAGLFGPAGGFAPPPVQPSTYGPQQPGDAGTSGSTGTPPRAGTMLGSFGLLEGGAFTSAGIDTRDLAHQLDQRAVAAQNGPYQPYGGQNLDRMDRHGNVGGARIGAPLSQLLDSGRSVGRSPDGPGTETDPVVTYDAQNRVWVTASGRTLTQPPTP